MPTTFSVDNNAFNQGQRDRRRGVARDKGPAMVSAATRDAWIRGWEWEDSRIVHIKIADKVISEAHNVILEQDKRETSQRKSKRESKGKTGH